MATDNKNSALLDPEATKRWENRAEIKEQQGLKQTASNTQS